MREAIFRNDYRTATDLIWKYQVCREGGSTMTAPHEPYGTMRTAGDIFITHEKESPLISRTLDISKGISVSDHKDFRREYFVSLKNRTGEIRITAKNTPISLKVEYDKIGGRLENSVRDENTFCGVESCSDVISYKEKFFGDGALTWAFYAVIQSDGEMTSIPGGKQVNGATYMVIHFAVVTDYKKVAEPGKAAESLVARSAEIGFCRLFSEQCKDFEALMTRSVLSLDTDEALRSLDTDNRLERVKEGLEDTGLSELYFNFGKYLLISSSAGGCVLPANLQGIWCKDNTPPWSCDYHVNINIQMNYWHALAMGLYECNDAFFRYIEFLSFHGKKTARVMYGCRGWVAHTVTTPWGFTSAGEAPSWGAFVTAGAWCCTHFF